MNFKFTSGEQPQVPEKVVEVTLAQKGADPKPMVVHQETTGAAQSDRLPLTLRLSTGVKSYGNGVEVAVTQTELYDPAVPGDKERAAKVYANTTPLTGADVAEAVVWCATLPPHFNVNRVEIMPTTQGPGALAVHRRPAAE